MPISENDILEMQGLKMNLGIHSPTFFYHCIETARTIDLKKSVICIMLSYNISRLGSMLNGDFETITYSFISTLPKLSTGEYVKW